MAGKTKNYNLSLPLKTEYVSIDVINDNTTKIDTALQENKTAAADAAKKAEDAASSVSSLAGTVSDNSAAIRQNADAITKISEKAADAEDGLSKKQDTLTFDSTPTEGSSNPVTSDGIKKAIEANTSSYTLPAATADTLGGVKVGSGLSIKDGVLSAENSGSGSSDYVLPAATADTLGGVKVGDGLTISDGVLSVKNTGSSGGSGTLSAPVSNYELLLTDPRGAVVGQWPVGTSTETLTLTSATNQYSFTYDKPSDSVVATLYENGLLEFTGEGDTIIIDDFAELIEGAQLSEYGAKVSENTTRKTASVTQYQPWYFHKDEIKAIRFGKGVIPSDLSNYFGDCKGLLSLPRIPSSVTNLFFTFFGCEGLTGHQTLSAKNMDAESALSDCYGIEELDVYTNDMINPDSIPYNCTGMKKYRIFAINITAGANINGYADGDEDAQGFTGDIYIETDHAESLDDALGGSFKTKNVEIESHGDIDSMKAFLPANPELLTLKVKCEGSLNAEEMTSDLPKCTDITVDAANVKSLKNAFLNDTALKNLDISSITSCPDISGAFQGCGALTGTITIGFKPTSYSNAFNGAATDSGASLVVNYTVASASVIDSIIATKSSGSHITKGSQVS